MQKFRHFHVFLYFVIKNISYLSRLIRMYETGPMQRNRQLFKASTLCDCPPGKKEFLYPKFTTLSAQDQFPPFLILFCGFLSALTISIFEFIDSIQKQNALKFYMK